MKQLMATGQNTLYANNESQNFLHIKNLESSLQAISPQKMSQEIQAEKFMKKLNDHNRVNKDKIKINHLNQVQKNKSALGLEMRND